MFKKEKDKDIVNAFTLVELIVVITILAILGTIAFISLQGYSKEARDSKRITDAKNLIGKISIQNTKGMQLSSLITNTKQIDLIINGTGAISNIGIANFGNLKEAPQNFKDPLKIDQDYPIAYSIGGTGSGTYSFIQIATVSEKDNQARLFGDYYEMKPGDAPSLFKSGALFIEDGKGVLPYNPDQKPDTETPPASNTCIVAFNMGINDPISPISLDCGEKIGTLPIPSMNSCFIFRGWQDGSGNPITENSVISNNTTIYPATQEITFNAYFDSQGGSSTETIYVPCSSGQLTFPNGPSRPSYIFKGWATNSSGGAVYQANDKISIIGDTTFYARRDIEIPSPPL